MPPCPLNPLDCRRGPIRPQRVKPGLLDAWLGSAGHEFAPVSCILGGILGQEVIKAVSGKGPVFKNFCFFSLEDGNAKVEAHGVEPIAGL